MMELFKQQIPQNIFMLEDDMTIIELIKGVMGEQLRSLGALFEIRYAHATSLTEATSQLKASRGKDYDLILVDLNLPDAEGMGALKAIRELCPNVPIVVMTGILDQQMGVSALSFGAQDYILKDAAFKDVLFRVCTYARYRYTQENKLRHAMRVVEKANATKDKFIAMVAHDIRGPLGAIANLAELFLEAKQSAPTAGLELIESIKTSADELLLLLEELIEISKLTTGKIIPKFQPLNAHALAEIVTTRLEHMASQKQITIQNNIPVDVEVLGDMTLLAQVMQNFVSNAIKFSHRGGVVEIFMNPRKSSAIVVKDNGVGIPKEKIPMLCRMEAKTSTPGTEGEAGVGLGLPLCAAIMRAHKGNIAIESHVGRGSAFVLNLPDVNPSALKVDDDPES